MSKFPPSKRFVYLPIAAVFAAAIWASPATAEGLASPWTEGFNNKARLIAGSAGAGTDKLYAGVEIAMPAGWKTYWRTPGDAGGVPPEFDWSASTNLRAARVLYPAPHRLIDKAGATIGYKDHVIFPVALTAKDPAQPIVLKLKAAYGVCKELCVPAEAEMEINVPSSAGISDELAAVLPAVPRENPISGLDPVIAGWRLDTRDGKPVLVIDVKDPSGSSIDAFVDVKDGTYLPMPKRAADDNGAAVYEVDLTDGVDVKDLNGKPISVTLVGATGQSETSITLP